MSSSTDRPRSPRTLVAFTLALVGFVVCDAVALLALGNVVSFWTIDSTVLLWTLAAGIVCLLAGILFR